MEGVLATIFLVLFFKQKETCPVKITRPKNMMELISIEH
jgi:hypothetical protein